MQDIIDVQYREVTVLEDMSTEELATEANSLWEQSEMVAAISLKLLAQAGERLLIIKDRLPHGQWEDWCADNLKFSKSKAEKVMLFASKVSDKNSIFAKTETFTDIGISKVYALLSASEEVAKTMIENPETRDMSVREFKDEIKRLKEEASEKQSQLDKAAEAVLSAESKVTELTEEINRLERALDETAEVPDNTEEVEKLKADLQTAKDKLAKEKENRKKDKEKTDRLIEAAKAEAEESAREKIEAESRNKMESLQLQLEDSQKTIAGLKDKLENNQQTEVTIFTVNFERLNRDFNDCIKSIYNVSNQNPAQADKMRTALKTAMNALMEEIG